MNFTLDWLSEFIDIALSSEKIADLLTVAGLEVESYLDRSVDYTDFCIAKIESVSQHPNADRLSLCEVRIASDTCLSIVCGARNVRAGMYTVCAKEGARLPSGLKIKKSKIRQVTSYGMLCSAEELALDWWFQKEEGILDLPFSDDQIGLSLNLALHIQNTPCYELSITPNRSDCLSVLGIARELCFLHESSHFHCLSPQVLKLTGEKTPVRVSVLLENASFAYAACVVRDINPSCLLPFKVYQRLHHNGITHKNAVVDVLNYMMLHLGQPLHAFDLDTLAGNLSIRFPRPGERVTLLNGVTVICDPETLVIADEKKIIAIAGVMGSLETAVTDKTRHILIESACFAPEYIMGQAKLYHLHSDAAYRFERGVDPAGVYPALEETVHWVLTYLGGCAEPFIQATGCGARRDLDKRITVHLDKVISVLGVEITPALFFMIMKRLSEGKVLDLQGDQTVLALSSPSYRYDLNIEEDFIEEVARFIGYDAIPDDKVALTSRFASRGGAEHYRAMHVRRILMDHGFQETLSLSFCSHLDHQLLFPNHQAITIVNPITQHYDVLRVDVSLSLLGHLRRNLAYSPEHFHCFEVGTVFEKKEQGFHEEQALSLLSYGYLSGPSWAIERTWVDFFDIKGVLERFLSEYEIRYSRTDQYTHLHPGRAAEMLCGDVVIGYLGEMHPSLLHHYHLPKAPILASLYLDRLPYKATTVFVPFLRHPFIERDFAVIVEEKIAAGDVLSFIRSHPFEGSLQVDLFDVFLGHGVPKDHKSLAFRLFFRHDTKNLEEEEIHAFFHGLIDAVCCRFSGVLRGVIH